MSRSKQIGTEAERRVTDWLKDNGWPDAHRIALKGINDVGDVWIGRETVIEVKAEKSYSLPQYMGELEAEIRNASADFGFVVVKKRGSLDVPHWFAVTPLHRMAHLMRRASL